MELQKVLQSAAKSDLARVRRNGSMFVLDTKIGSFELSYEGKEYVARKVIGIDAVILMKGKASIATDFLMSSYQIDLV